jgi:hypothetical protein
VRSLCLVAPVDVLVALKRSHVFWPLDWDKVGLARFASAAVGFSLRWMQTIRDLYALLAMEAKQPPDRDRKLVRRTPFFAVLKFSLLSGRSVPRCACCASERDARLRTGLAR